MIPVKPIKRVSLPLMLMHVLLIAFLAINMVMALPVFG